MARRAAAPVAHCLNCERRISARRLRERSGAAVYFCSDRCVKEMSRRVGGDALDKDALDALLHQDTIGLAVFFGRRVVDKVKEHVAKVRQAQEEAQSRPPPKPKPRWGTSKEELNARLAAFGLPPTATVEDVDKRYRDLAKKNHPDVLGGSAERMAEINAARDRIKELLA